MQVHLFWPWIKVTFAIISARDWKTIWSLNVVWATADLLPLGAQSLLVQLQRFRPPTNYCLKRLTMRKSESMPPTERRWKTRKKWLLLTQMHVTQIVRPPRAQSVEQICHWLSHSRRRAMFVNGGCGAWKTLFRRVTRHFFDWEMHSSSPPPQVHRSRLYRRMPLSLPMRSGLTCTLTLFWLGSVLMREDSEPILRVELCYGGVSIAQCFFRSSEESEWQWAVERPFVVLLCSANCPYQVELASFVCRCMHTKFQRNSFRHFRSLHAFILGKLYYNERWKWLLFAYLFMGFKKGKT